MVYTNWDLAPPPNITPGFLVENLTVIPPNKIYSKYVLLCTIHDVQQ